ncbi:MAG TPA: DUF1566 domain-containing protein [bacterium]|nr:DUF1566 domain-containing protein [bacterium]
MRYALLLIAFFAISCAQRPDAVDAAEAYNNWMAAHPDEDIDNPAEVESDIDDPYEPDEDIDDLDLPHDPDLHEEDIDMIDEDLVDEDLIINPMTCNADTCDDPYSGLTWQKNSSYTGTQGNSASFCTGIDGFGGFMNWRLPTIAELKTLRRNCDNDAGCADAAVCYWDVALAGACDKPHWSSTLAGGTQYSTLNFKTGKVAAVESNVDQYARCVTDTTK